MRKLVLISAACAAFSVTLAGAVLLLPAETEAAQASEYELKAAYLFNFLSFITLPEERAPGQTFSICIVEGAKLEGYFGSLEGETVREQKIRVLYPAQSADLSGCQVVFIPQSEGAKAQAILKRTQGLGAVTVGEQPDFCDLGGMINFFVADSRLRFAVNVERAGAEKISFSSKLLKRAEVVKGDISQAN